MKIKTGDTVIMLSGKDKGKTGKILRVFPKENAAVVEGLNLVKKHRKPRRQGQKGEIISMPRSISASKVMLICRHCKRPSRMGIKREGPEGVASRPYGAGKKLIRICKKCHGEN